MSTTDQAAKTRSAAAQSLVNLEQEWDSREITNHDYYVALRLMITVYSMKPAYQRGAEVIAQLYASTVGFDPDKVIEQAEVRIAHEMQFQDIVKRGEQ